MADRVTERVLDEAKYIIFTHNTVRKTAIKFGVSKSTVHNDMSKRLQNISLVLHRKTSKILKENFQDKHIRGGESTRKKYKSKKEG